MSIFFISDIHLSEDQPEITQRFLSFLEKKAPEAEALYILGDLFEVWIGDDDKTEFNTLVINAIKKLSIQGIPVYLMHGNRDFLIRNYFAKAAGCKLISDPSVVTLYGIPVLLMHGDSLCIHDQKYQKFRKRARNKLLLKIFLMKSLKARRIMAQKYRSASKVHTKTELDQLLSIPLFEIKRVMKKFHVSYFIHGHLHKQQVEHLDIDGRQATRIVLDSWETKGNILIVDQGKAETLDYRFIDWE